MRTWSNNDRIFLGRNAGEELIRAIKDAKSSVKIVSPYLSSSYVKELVELSKKGKKVTLITCDKLVDKGNRYSDLDASELVKETKTISPEKEKIRKTGMFFGLIALLISLALFSVSLFVQTGVFISIPIFLISSLVLGYYFLMSSSKIEYAPIFRIKVFDSTSGNRQGSAELIHAKIYVIDEKVAYLGSANFSYSGFKKHYESLIEIQDSKAVKEISNEVEALYNSNFLKEKPIEDWI